LGLGNQQAVERIVVHQRELGSLNHMTIQHRQKQRTSSEALITKGSRRHRQLAQAVLDSHLPDAGDRHHARACGHQITGFGAQPGIVEQPPEHDLGVEQQAPQLPNISAAKPLSCQTAVQPADPQPH
jgi:hypothetical protein